MIPIHWRYLLTPYLKTFFLASISFIIFILVTRLQGIASIAALGASWKILSLYTLYQIPYILPLAITLSSLLGGFLVFQRLSVTHELTALRASGLSFKQIICPILICNLILAALSFFIVSELATTGKIHSSMMKHKMNTFSPLIIFQNSSFLKTKGIYADLNVVEMGEKAENVLIAYLNKRKGRISLFIASELEQKGDSLVGNNVSIISSTPPDKGSQFDNLIIENQKEFITPISVLSWYFTPHRYNPKSAYLKLSLLLIQLRKAKEAYKEKQSSGGSDIELIELKKQVNIPKSELMRRISLALSTFSLSLLGITFGTKISRNGNVKGVLLITLLTSLSLACFFLAKELHHNFLLSSFLYIGPHIVNIGTCTYVLKRLMKGYI